MLLSDKIVTQLPLTSLWTDRKELQAIRVRCMDGESVRELVKQTPVLFVLADAGSKLQWINVDSCYQFWKEEVQAHLANSIDNIQLDDFPGGYAYIASEWTSENKEPVILLEKVH